MRKTLLCAMLLCVALMLICLGGCGVPASGAGEPSAAGEASAPAGTPSSAPSAAPDPSPDVSPDAAPPSAAAPTPEPTPEPTLEPTPEPTPTPPPYLFGTPVEESAEVDGTEWFADAVFVGDSRTEGVQVYSGIKNADFLWHRGLSVFKATDPEYRVFDLDGQKVALSEALSAKQYAKVYLMIGTNELGYKASAYESGLSSLLDMLHTAQPTAVIYLQTLPPVNEEVARSKGLSEYINNRNVNAFNEAIVRQAREHRVALLDVASLFRGEDGRLPADMASDGVHFRKAGYQLWAEYLRTHTLDWEDYTGGQPADELWTPDVPAAPDAVEGEMEP